MFGKSKFFRVVSILVVVAGLLVNSMGLPIHAAPPSSLNDVNTYLFADTVTDMRGYRLIQSVQPDMIHRGMYEWAGTALADKQWSGAAQVVQNLKQGGSFVIGGVSGFYWQPDMESGPATVDQATKDRCSIPNSGWGDVRQLNIAENTALQQLIYKAKKQIDAGVNGIEFDEFGMGWTDYNYVKSALSYIRNELKNYAQTKFGRDVYIATNSKVGGQNFPNFTETVNDGTEPVDFYIRNLPYKLVGLSQNDPNSLNDYDGTFNYIPYLRNAHSAVWPKRFYYFIDFGGATTYWAPHNPAQWPNFLRISSANVIASGGFPGHFFSFYQNLDAYNMGVFQDAANLTKFMDENSELWHNLSFINPAITTSVTNIYTSAFGQNGRTILHLVNGNFNNSTQTMSSKTNFTAKIKLDSQPVNIWMTTPDKPSKDRKTTLNFSWNSSTKEATITVPQLDYHDVIIIEQGSPYNPVYAPLEVKFPFPNPSKIYVGNKLQVTAVATDGRDGIFDWYVNGIAGGNSTVGTISSSGLYTAPATVPNPSTVTIKAQSRIDTTRSNQFNISVQSSASLPWSDNFASDTSGSIATNWHIVDGRGDWTVALDGSTKVLTNNNISEGNGNAVTNESALFSPFITSGDQKLTDYEFSASIKLRSEAIKLNKPGWGTFAAMVFRYKDPKNYYFYTLEADNAARLYKCVNGTITEIGGGAFSGFLTSDAYTKVRVQVNGSSFKLMVGPRVVRSDSDSTFSSGAVGFKASYTSSYFKDITVSQLPQESSEVVDMCNDFSKVYQKSSGLGIDNSNAGYMGGDNGRFFRGSQATAEYITYSINNQSSAYVTAYFWPDEAVSHYKFYTSVDNLNWTEVMPIVATTSGVSPNWHKVVYEINGMPSTVKYLKIQWQNLTGQSWSPQLGQVELKAGTTANYTDSCNVLPSLRSTNIGVDTANYQNVWFDSARLFRSSGNQAEWVKYNLNGIRTAVVNAYFWENEPISHYKFYLSKDNISWEYVLPWTTVDTRPSSWHRATYTLDKISEGYNYLKIEWQNQSGQSWTPQIGRVSIDYTGATGTANLVTNQGFEDGVYGWELPQNFSITNTDKYSGNNSMKLTGTGSNGFAWQTLSVKPNTQYSFSFYAKCSKQNWCKVLGSNDSMIAQKQTTANNVWTKYTLSFNSGSNSSVKIYVGDNGESAGGTLYFDDFEIK